MVQLYLLDKICRQSETFSLAFLRALRMIRAMVPKQSPSSTPSNHHWATHDEYLPHVLSLRNIYRERAGAKLLRLSDIGLEFAELLSDAGNYMYERYIIPEAFAVLETAEQIISKLPESEDREINPVKLQILFLQASIELNHGSTKRADALWKKKEIVTLRRRRARRVWKSEADWKEKGLVGVNLSVALNNLACAYLHCDQYEQAAPLFKKSLCIKKKWRGDSFHEQSEGHNRPQRPGFAELKKNYALIQLSRGKFESAIRWSKEAAEMVHGLKSAGPKSKMGLFFKFMHVCVLFNAGEEVRALEENIKILKAREELFGKAHDHTVDSYYAVGMMYFHSGNLGEAR
jgi:tetratricopeptide (TPR) repeat protein